MTARPDLTAAAPPAADDCVRYFGRHSRSFRFAAAFMPAAERALLARVYAFCRYTDDLADRADPAAPSAALAALDRWRALARAAYDGRASGVALLDQTMGEMAGGGVPFEYAGALVDGVRSDVTFAPFADMAALRQYTYRVASTVGLWLSELYGVRDPWMLERAAALGHAMQLTNIIRDVGEDWDAGRLYLPLDMLRAHDLSPDDVGAMRRGERTVCTRYRALTESLMRVAAADYAAARAAIPLLPRSFARPVAVAAAVYEGIHARVRANGYDNLTRRAYTHLSRKAVLGARALAALHWEPRPARALPPAAARRGDSSPWSWRVAGGADRPTA